MRTLFVNKRLNLVTANRADTVSVGNTARSANAISLPWGGGEIFKLGFLESEGSSATVDMGSSLTAALILKAQTPAGSAYDGPPLTACTTWTRSGTSDAYWYTGTLDMSRLELAKLLGMSLVTAKEKLLVQCVADVDGSLDGTSLKIAIDNAATPHVCYFDFHISSGVDTTPGAGNYQKRVTLSANDTATTVATAFAAAVNDMTASIGWTATSSGANVTLTKSTVMAVGAHDPLSSGFSFALLALGGTAGSTSDVASVTLNGEFSFVVDGNRQLTEIFAVTLKNSLYRPGQTAIPSGLTTVTTLTLPIGLTTVTGYTGGTSANLDGIATAGGAMSTGQVVWFIHATEGLRFFQLVAGTDAESSPAIIRPDDYNGSTNARVWKQV